MYRTLVAVALLVPLFPGGPAHAADPLRTRAKCEFSTFGQSTVTGPDHYVGVAAGVVVTPDSTPVTFRCVLRVDGVEVAATPPRHGTGVVASAGPVEYDASDLAWVDMCREVTPDGGSTTLDCSNPGWCGFVEGCYTEEEQEVLDAVDGVWTRVLDPAVCPVLAASAPGIPGVVDIAPDGDTTVAGLLVEDCPPYGQT